MWKEGSNDVAIFRSSRYLNVGAGVVVGQISVINIQNVFIFFRSSVVIFFLSIICASIAPTNRSSHQIISLNCDIAIGTY